MEELRKWWGVSKSDRQAQFDQLKNDILTYGSQLHDLRVNNRERFDQIFSSIDFLVTKIDMTEDVHYFRNEPEKGDSKYSMFNKKMQEYHGSYKKLINQK